MATYKRILLKLSGESLMGEKQYGIDEKRLAEYAAQIKEIHELGVQIGIVIGGGNIFRGLSGANKGFDRVKGDQMGMLATVINSLALSSALVAAGVKARVLTAVRMEPIGEFYNKWRAIECMEAGEVVIMSAGTGNPFFTTDTGSSLRGIEIEADVMLKGTRVDGIYTADPEKDPTATKFHDITYDEVLKRGLKVMDLTATCMCKENNLPIIVFDMDTVGNLKKVDMAIMYLDEALAHIRAGKADIRLLDGIRVDSYGSMVPINNVAAVTTPDARSIAIKPWDKSMFRVIEKAIIDSSLGIMPENNGEIIRIGIPPLTEERRKQLAKQCKGEGETAKVSVRNARRDAIDALKKSVKDGLAEDAQKGGEEKLQKIHDKFIKQIDDMLAAKDKEIMTV